MPHLGRYLISRKLFTANLLSKQISEYTSKVDNLALFVMATNYAKNGTEEAVLSNTESQQKCDFVIHQ